MRSARWLLLLGCALARGAEPPEPVDEDAAALSLPSAGVTQDAAGIVAASFEGAETVAARRGANETNLQRLSADFRMDGSFAPGWRTVFAERLDSDWAGANQEVGTLKEAYVSWQPLANFLLDAGRINARQGVAFGYNPTDFLRAGAIRSLVSLDPNSLRENRLGTAMLRAQGLWNGGALSVAYAPRLTDHTSGATFDPDFGATNSQNRWLVSFSQQLGAGLTPQWLAFGRDGQSAQAGVNLTAVIGSSTVAYVEVSAGRSAPLLAQSLGLAAGESVKSRGAAGFTYSMANKLSLTVEYEYNGAALSSSRWSSLRSGNLSAYGRYREYALLQQDLPTQSNAFIYASWQDLLFQHLDLTAFVREDLIDGSRLPWLELRRHWTSIDLALRWQNTLGSATSNYGASAERQTWQLLLDYYL